jgi:cytochrome c-type biogenesis protein CcmF
VLIAGKACLILVLATSLYGIGASLYGAGPRRREWVASGRRAVYAVAATTALAFLILEAAFLRSDFTFTLVTTHSSTTTPAFYRATAVWSSQEGSLLLWLLLLSLWSSLILFLTRRRLREIAPYATAVLLGFATFFAALLVFLESPFGQSSPAPSEGVGLNPLLRHPSMMIHPPMLYSGYTLFAVPFAFAVGALITRRLNADWIRGTRPFTLAAWFFLGVGIVLGARWSYSELGWGGYWAWDPVENASLMPWLTGTAFLHSGDDPGAARDAEDLERLARARHGRAGDPRHVPRALGDPGLDPRLRRLDARRAVPGADRDDDRRLDRARGLARLRPALGAQAGLAALARVVFLLNNLVLVAMCFVIFWGTFFPLISEAITGEEASVGPPWFDQYTVPLALMLVLLSGIGPGDRVAPRDRLEPAPQPAQARAGRARRARRPGPARRRLRARALLMFGLGAFVLAAVGQELWRGVRARRAMSGDSVPTALVPARAPQPPPLRRLPRPRGRRGAVHRHRRLLELPGRARGAAQAGPDRRGRRLPGHLRQADRGHQAANNGRLEKIDFGAQLRVTKDGEKVADMTTVKSYFPSLAPFLGPISRFFEGEATSEVGLKAGWRRDIWTAIAPDIGALRPRIEEGDKVFSGAEADAPSSARRSSARRSAGSRAPTRATRRRPPSA